MFALRLTRRTLPLVAALLAVLCHSHPVHAAFEQSMAIPAYFYPPALWPQVDSAAPTVGLVIANPASGPGMMVDPNYTTSIGTTRAMGITVIGYVYTSYGARSAAAVQADIDLWYSLYTVDGIFFDEASNNCADQPYYASLDAYVKGKGGVGRTVLNFGINVPECFVTATDILLNFEGNYTSYQSWSPSGWESSYAADRFWHLVYDTTEAQMSNAVLLSQARGAGWVYVTPDTLINPWDSLPSGSYWTNELALIRPLSGGCPNPVAKPKLAVSGLTNPAGEQAFKLSGSFTLPGAPAFDPLANGLRVLIGGANGPLYDITLPGGAYAEPPGSGWSVNGAATTWKYSDTSATPLGGITSVKVKDLSSREPGLVKFKVKGRDTSLLVTAPDLPLGALVLLDPTSPTSLCGSATFPGPAPVCSLNGSASAVKCK